MASTAESQDTCADLSQSRREDIDDLYAQGTGGWEVSYSQVDHMPGEEMGLAASGVSLGRSCELVLTPFPLQRPANPRYLLLDESSQVQDRSLCNVAMIKDFHPD